MPRIPHCFAREEPGTYRGTYRGRWPGSEPRDDPRATALAGTSSEAVEERVCSWLKTGLETWGAGAKTAAGYGYFNSQV
ncbi:MAG TPA: hypothetical protein VIA62_01705 [Thermoanaerobaculia bacterium]|nr:hypothetical protein [Thermoanaerobaculia bacterium]